MKKYLIYFLVLLSLNLNLAKADEYNRRLKKVSLLLTGKLPKDADLVLLANLNSSQQKDQFIANKTDELLRTGDYVQKMRERTEELMNLVVTHEGKFQSDDDGYAVEEDIRGSMHGLLTDLFQDNLSWDTLLTSTNYKYFFTNEDFGFNYLDIISLDDVGFYSYNYGYKDENIDELKAYLAKAAAEENNRGAVIPRATQEGVENLAGVITTDRFFTRYPTTRINKNRKRAAAVFRMFLCDAMTPALLPSSQENLDLLDMALGKPTNSNMQEMPEEQRHGQDPQCMSCHHKLDPMAQTFIGSGVVPNRRTTPGALVYYEENEHGEKTQISIPVSGLGDLGKKITEQPTYSQCQVTHMWNWFIGEDIPLSYNKKLELASRFDQLDRRPNDFIKFLLNSEDFKNPTKITIGNIRYSHVQPILKKCDSCHQKSQGPRLSSGYPYSPDSMYNNFSLGQILWATDLREESANDYMPPRNAGWKLEGYDRELLKAWFKTGAKDNNGVTKLNSDELRLDRVNYDPEFLEANNHRFKNTSNRYMSSYDLINVLTGIYGDSPDCSEIRNQSQRVNMGFLNPIDGSLLLSQPNSALLGWIRNCANSSLNMNLGKHLPDDLKEQTATKWQDLSVQNKQRVIKYAIRELIGFKVLDNSREMALEQRIIRAMDRQNGSLGSTLRLIHTGLLTGQYFLSY